MPLVTIGLSDSWSLEGQKMIADGIHNAITGVGFPLKDRFQKIHRLSKDQFIYDDRHPDLIEARSEQFVLVGTINCRELTGADLTTPEGIEKYMSSDTPQTVCFPAVSAAYKLVMDVLKENT